MADPTVFIISGSDHFRRRRFLKGFVSSLEDGGRQVTRTTGDEIGVVHAAIADADFTGQKALIVVDEPQKLNLAFIEGHAKDGDDQAVLALHYEGKPRGNTKFGKLVKKLGKQHKEFTAPKTWDAPDVAATFCVEEAQAGGYTLDPRLAAGLVSLVGPDLGLLSYEVMKVMLLAESEGTKAITAAHIKALRAEVAEAEVFPIVQALEHKQAKRLVRTMDQLKRTSKYSPVMRVCRVIGSQALLWMTAANLDAKGVASKDAAQQLDQNKWYYETKILPPARRWGEEGAIRLVKALAESERALLSGQIDPWTGLQARLLKLC